MDYWLEHEDPDCAGRWQFSRRSQVYYCRRCHAFHFLSDWSRRSYARWIQVERALEQMVRCP